MPSFSITTFSGNTHDPKAPCLICGQPLKSGCHPTHLKDVHRKDDDPKYPFGICDRMLICKYILKIHKRLHALKEFN